MRKGKIIEKNRVKYIKCERDILSKINHPFIVNMYYAFQDDDYLYLVMDLLTGGDLHYHFSRFKRFTEKETSKKFLYLII